MKKILAFNVDEETFMGLKKIADNMKSKLVKVPNADFSQKISDLVEERKNVMMAPFNGSTINESMILICDFSDKELDKLLAAIRIAGLKIDFKAMLTETNSKWNVLALYFEMIKERAAFLKR